MYSNIGKKIMMLVKVCNLVIGVCAFIGCCVFLVNENFAGITALAIITLLCPIAFWPLYGFGQLVDDVHAIRNQSTEPTTQNDELPEL